MPSGAPIRRVGGLAVALGVGAAVISGWSSGPAWADESSGSSGSTTSGSAAGTKPGSAESSGASVEADSPATSSGTGTTTAGAVDGEPASRPGVTPPGSEEPEITSATPPETSADEDEPTAEPRTPKGSDRPTADPPKSKIFAPMSSVADDEHDDGVPTAVPKTHSTSDPTQPSSPVSARIASPQSARVAVAYDEPATAPMPAEPRQPDLVGVVTRLVSGVVSAVLSPFAASNTPGVPIHAPSLWSLLAFARREFETAFASLSLTGTPADSHTTSQTLPAETATSDVEERTLILTAFPAEADAILARTTLDPNPTVIVDGHHFYLGSIGGKKVIVAMTGIGMENATQTTETALDHFTAESGVSIGAVVFSGVAGGSGRTQIGSVAVPGRWTSDDGATWHSVDPEMFATANGLTVDLGSTANLGDPLCLCNPLAHLPLVDLKREPQLFVGGDGLSDDNNNGAAFPAIPFGGDIFGPQPCLAPDYSPLFVGNFFQAVVPFLARGLISNLTGLLAPVAPAVDAVDQETAAAQQVAEAHGIPFLGIRGMSDGPGDPLGLPGYPFTFVVYRQIAADNAAIVTEAFLQNWDGPDGRTGDQTQ